MARSSSTISTLMCVWYPRGSEPIIRNISQNALQSGYSFEVWEDFASVYEKISGGVLMARNAVRVDGLMTNGLRAADIKDCTWEIERDGPRRCPSWYLAVAAPVMGIGHLSSRERKIIHENWDPLKGGKGRPKHCAASADHSHRIGIVLRSRRANRIHRLLVL
jgi:hypothetical protein